MIKRRGPSDSGDEELDAQAEAAGLGHWSSPPGDVPSVFDTEDDPFGPQWQLEEDEDKWGTELSSVFDEDDDVTGQIPEIRSSPTMASRSTRRGENDPRVARARRIAAERAAQQQAAAVSEKAPNRFSVEATASDPDLKTEDFPSKEMPAIEEPAERVAEIDDAVEEFAAPKGDRNLGQASAVGLIVFAIAAALLLISDLTAIALVGVVALLAVAELFQAMKSEVLNPAKVLGYVSVLAIPTAAFFRGTEAFPLIIGLVVIFGALWYLTGADTERPVLNLGLTLFGVLWVGGLAGFAGLILGSDYEAGRQVLIAAIVITAASDVFAYLGGRAYGKTGFHTASPSKTWEGSLTGFLGALATGLMIGIFSDIISNESLVFKGNFTAALALGLVIGVLAPIGDLGQSMLKRDLGIKDSGSILPGHGGVFDRVDGLLFALPGAYYVATFFDLIPVF